MSTHITYYPKSTADREDLSPSQLEELREILRQSVSNVGGDPCVAIFFHVGSARGTFYACGVGDIDAPSSARDDAIRCAGILFAVARSVGLSFAGFCSFLFEDLVASGQQRQLIESLEGLARTQDMSIVTTRRIEGATLVRAMRG